MFVLFQKYIEPFLNDPNLVAVPIILALLTYLFAHQLKIDELLFNTRREIYSQFMKEYGVMFHPHELTDVEHYLDETAELQRKYERHQKLANLVAQSRLVSGFYLEGRLRDLFDLIIEEDDDKKFNETERMLKTYERVIVGVEVEALMRSNMRALNKINLFIRLIASYFERKKIQYNLATIISAKN